MKLDIYKQLNEAFLNIMIIEGFEKEACLELKKSLSLGHNIDFEDLAVKFFDFQRKKIPQNKYQIKYSSKFKNHALILPKERAQAIEEIKAKLQNGENVTPYLSEKVRQHGHKDTLLNSWGIHHLHLSSIKTMKHGFVKRAKALLLIIVVNEKAYFLDIVKHNRKYEFCDPEYIRILVSDFPELCNISNLGPAPEPQESNTQEVGFTAEQLKSIMAKNGNAGFRFNGKPISVKDGGIFGDGSSMYSRKFANSLQQKFLNIEHDANQRFKNAVAVKIIGLVFDEVFTHVQFYVIYPLAQAKIEEILYTPDNNARPSHAFLSQLWHTPGTLVPKF